MKKALSNTEAQYALSQLFFKYTKARASTALNRAQHTIREQRMRQLANELAQFYYSSATSLRQRLPS